MSDLIKNPDRFSHDAAHISDILTRPGLPPPLRKHSYGELILLKFERKLSGFRPGTTQTRLYSYRRWLEALNFRFRKKRDCTIYVSKTKALISFAVAVTAKLICVFVFVYAKRWFSHDAAQILF